MTLNKYYPMGSCDIIIYFKQVLLSGLVKMMFFSQLVLKKLLKVYKRNISLSFCVMFLADI